MATTYTLRVAGVTPSEKRLWRNSSTEPMGQWTGSRARCLHHEAKSLHLKPYKRLVEGALELMIVTVVSAERPEHINPFCSGATPIASINLAEGAKSCPKLESTDGVWEESPKEGRPTDWSGPKTTTGYATNEPPAEGAPRCLTVLWVELLGAAR